MIRKPNYSEKPDSYALLICKCYFFIEPLSHGILLFSFMEGALYILFKNKLEKYIQIYLTLFRRYKDLTF